MHFLNNEIITANKLQEQFDEQFKIKYKSKK
jgi:hypothetical protein